MKHITAELEEAIRQWIRQGYTDPSETPLDDYAKEVLREVLVAAGCDPKDRAPRSINRPATEPETSEGVSMLGRTVTTERTTGKVKVRMTTRREPESRKEEQP
jgi:hypothetical protein